MFHVVTPFSRPENVPVLVRHLVGQGVALTWHPVVGDVAFPEAWLRDWIRPLVVEVPGGIDPFCYKLRAFVESGRVVDGERYGMLCDDDFYGIGLLATVGGMDEPVVVVSMQRGQRAPERTDGGFVHPTGTLWAGAEMMGPGGMGLQQVFMTGEVLRRVVVDVDRAPVCDGVVGEWLAREYGAGIRYEPGLFVLFNRLEPGRWAVDEDELWR